MLHFVLFTYIQNKEKKLKIKIKEKENKIKLSLLFTNLTPFYALVVTDASIKNNMATSIVHIHVYNKSVIKTIHYAVNIMTTEAELFTIRYRINQTTNIPGISKIVIVTDMLHTV